MNSWVNLSAVAKVFAVGLLAGAGLPALFAIGLRAVAPVAVGHGAAPGSVARGRLSSRRVAGIGLAAVCFVIILIGAASGIALLVRG